MPIETYDVVMHDIGVTPPTAPAADGADSGVPGAPPDAPAVREGDAGAPPAQPSPSVGETEGDEPDEPEAVTTEEFNRAMARLRQRQRRAERALEAERVAYQQDKQELAHLRGQLEVMTRLMQGQSPDLGEPAPRTGPPPRPQADQYTDQAAYDQAMDVWLDQRTDYRAAQRDQVTQAQQQLIEREAAFKAQHADYDQVINTNLRGKTAPHVQQALMLLPEGPALAYTLAQQPETLARLNQLPPPLVFAELGRLSPPTNSAPPATNGAPPVTHGTASPAAPPTAQLDAPYTPANGQGSAPTGTYREDMSQADYRALRQRTSNLSRWQNQRRG